jgi:hypothetical protein
MTVKRTYGWCEMKSVNDVYGVLRLVKHDENFQVEIGGVNNTPSGYTEEQWKDVLRLIGTLLYKQAAEYEYAGKREEKQTNG